jgi:hypothetical protein
VRMFAAGTRARARSLGLCLAATLALSSCKKTTPAAAPEPPAAPATLAEHALARARALPDPLGRTRLVTGLALGWSRAGRSAEVPALLDEAQASASRIESAEERGFAAVEVVEAALAADEVARAATFAKAIALPQRRAEAELRRADRLAARGDFVDAEATAKAIARPEERHEALARLTIRLAELDRAELAEGLLSEVGEGPWRDEALGQVALARARQGLPREYEALFLRLANPHARGETQVALALWYARGGRREEAQRVVKVVESSWLRARAQAALALLADGEGSAAEASSALDAAIDTALGIGEPMLRGAALLDVARRLADAGRPGEAEALLAKIDFADARNEGLAHLVALAAERERFADAERLLSLLQADALWSGRAAQALVRAYARARNSARALDTARRIILPEARLPALAEAAVQASLEGQPARDGERAAFDAALEAR